LSCLKQPTTKHTTKAFTKLCACFERKLIFTLSPRDAQLLKCKKVREIRTLSPNLQHPHKALQLAQLYLYQIAYPAVKKKMKIFQKIFCCNYAHFCLKNKDLPQNLLINQYQALVGADCDQHSRLKVQPCHYIIFGPLQPAGCIYKPNVI